MGHRKATILIVPGYADSGPQHWQSRWLSHFSHSIKVFQKDWIHVERDAWVAALDAAIQKAIGPIVLVGHSLGCSAILAWVHSHRGKKCLHKIRGAFLVAPPDPQSDAFRALTIQGFDTLFLHQLPFPSILVASENDPFLSLEKAKAFAHAWGARCINAGKRGHLGDDSGVGEWEEGRKWLLELIDQNLC